MNLRHLSTLQRTLAASIAIHAVLLTVRFVDPESMRRVFEDTPLEVILVNAHSNEAPTKAQAIAQTSLAGGGDAEAGRASSMLPSSALEEVGDLQEQVAASKLQSLEQQQNLLLAHVKKQLQALNPHELKANLSANAQREQEEKRKQLSRLLAEIERRINAENARPKKGYISPAVRGEAYALYYDNLRRSIESKGTNNFPIAAGRKLYGELTMVVTINHDGRVLDTEIVEGSGNAQLDQRAAAIARSAGPFGPFTQAIRKQFDQLVIVSHFKFTREETLEATVGAQP